MTSFVLVPDTVHSSHYLIISYSHYLHSLQIQYFHTEWYEVRLLVVPFVNNPVTQVNVATAPTLCDIGVLETIKSASSGRQMKDVRKPKQSIIL